MALVALGCIGMFFGVKLAYDLASIKYRSVSAHSWMQMSDRVAKNHQGDQAWDMAAVALALPLGSKHVHTFSAMSTLAESSFTACKQLTMQQQRWVAAC